MQVLIKKAREHELPMPYYAKVDDAGLMLCADLSKWGERLIIPPHSSTEIETGWCFQWPAGYVGLVMGRSGLAFRSNVRPFYAGVVDRGYSGEILVLLENDTNQDFIVNHGDAIAQLLIMPVARAVLEEVDLLPPTARGATWAGSSDVAHKKLLEQPRLGMLYVLKEKVNQPTLDGEVWSLKAVNARGEYITLNNTTTGAEICVESRYLLTQYECLGDPLDAKPESRYMHDGRMYELHHLDTATACFLMVEVHERDAGNQIWVRMDQMRAEEWKRID